MAAAVTLAAVTLVADVRELEHPEAVRVMRWAKGAVLKWPALKWLHHIPNGGKRSRAVAGKLKAEGVKKGVSDYFLPWPMLYSIGVGYAHHGGGMVKYLGFYIELKAPGHTYCTPDQKEFLTDMKAAGYAATWCRGASEMVDALTLYLEGEWKNQPFAWEDQHD